MTDTQHILYKHTGSSASDATTDIEIDLESKMVRIRQLNYHERPFFSSSLIEGAIQTVERDHGAKIIVDDAASWGTQQSEWKVIVAVGEREYEARFYRLVLAPRPVCVELWPL